MINEIGQAHDVAHAAQRLAFERESVGVGGVGVARGAAKAEHRIGLVRLEGGAAEERGVFVGLEVRQPDDHRLGIEGGGDRADALGEVAHEILARRGEGARPLGDLRALLGADPLGMGERHRMHADMLVDDELHARQADAGVGRHRGAERHVGIAEVRHDLASSA